MQAEADGDYRWIAYELHDGLLQWLVGAQMSLEVVLSEANSLAPEMVERLRQIRSILESGVEEGRDLIAFLESDKTRPEVDLCDAMHDFLERVRPQLNAVGQELEIVCPDPDWPPMAADRAWNVLRIAQQAIRNAIQHAGPCRVVVSAGWAENGQLRLAIVDSGRGFSVQEVDRSQHFGLSGIEHRARQLGAQLTIDSAPGRGTRIEIQFAHDRPN
ncbi:MAG: hypothetical protein KatS3mg111_1276 [Pirellulaceae bacterium]|nr:MAG: hypothetical protein KatS3mg111_1276 [Pirellulaceae bacterium]